MDNDGKANLSLARINQDGSLDASGFGTNGKGTVTTLIPPDFQNSSGALTLQADGRIIVGGTTDGNLTLVRYNTNGTLDTTFGGTGIVTTDFGSLEQMDDFVIQADGKIIMSGKVRNNDQGDFLLLRYNSDGSLDTSFGIGGKVVTDFGGSTDTAMGIAQQADGKVILTGASEDNATLVRYDTNTSVITNSLTFKSAGAYDGWIIESGENTNQGGSIEKISNALFIGDDAKDRQYRSILSFDTNSIPDNVTITSAQVKIREQGHVGTNPLSTHGNLLLELRSGTFSNNVTLVAGDFSAIANIGSTQDKFSGAGGDWYIADLSSINLGLVNKYGVTQFRLLFSKDDNDDMGADYARFFSGNSPSDQPQLIVTYSTAGGQVNRAPVIISNGGEGTASVSVPENSPIVTKVTATDADYQPITYSISGPDAGNFSIDSSVGVLTFIFAPDFEAIPTGTVYHVIVQASDGKLFASQDIAVTVTGLNEYPPVITSNGGGATASLSLPENTIDVTTVSASDADLPAPSLTYSIVGGADAALLAINPSDGKLSFVTAPSYNAPNDAGLDHVYNVTVQASDGEFIDSQELAISILPPNPPPVSSLNSSFGSNGVAATKFNGLPSSTRDIVLQLDGKIIVLGDMQLTRVVARYNANGSLDTSFGANGIASNTFPSFSGKALALQPDGKVIVAGWQKSFAAVRYNSNGTLDTSFGTNGLAALDPANVSTDISYYIEDVTIQPDGKIVMAGSYGIGNHIEIEVVRFNSDGTRDVIKSMDWGTLAANTTTARQS